jgi:pantoate kinase
MVRAAIAFSPAHISGYFCRLDGSDPASTGSRGAGIVIGEGVTARVTAADVPSVLIRQRSPAGAILGRTEGSPLLLYAMGRLGVNARVVTTSPLPMGAGFGCSAAALLATITALSALFSLELSREEIAALAHEAEVVHRTGLGDVAALQGGGLACRNGPGIHAGIVRLMPEDASLTVLSCGPMHTPAVLGSAEAMERVARAFPGRCPRDREDFFTLSRSFSEQSGLITPAVRRILTSCDRRDIPASMTMLGEGVFAGGAGAREALAPFGTPLSVQISGEGFSPAEVEE